MSYDTQKTALGTIRRNPYLANLLQLQQVMSKADIKKECAKAGATSRYEENAVMEKLLRAHAQKHAVKLPSEVSTIVDSEQPARALAKVPSVAHAALLTTTAAQWVRMTTSERESFGASNGRIHIEEFNRLTPAQKSKLCASGAKPVDTFETPPQVKPAPAGARSMTRTQFELMDAATRMAFVKSGGTITDDPEIKTNK